MLSSTVPPASLEALEPGQEGRRLLGVPGDDLGQLGVGPGAAGLVGERVVLLGRAQPVENTVAVADPLQPRHPGEVAGEGQRAQIEVGLADDLVVGRW